jgi:hypothetical protein
VFGKVLLVFLNWTLFSNSFWGWSGFLSKRFVFFWDMMIQWKEMIYACIEQIYMFLHNEYI